MDRNVDTCRQDHVYVETCQYCVPEAIICALEATSFEDAIRNAISLGGDADTLAAISGSIAETLFGIPNSLNESTKPYLVPELNDIIEKFYEKISCREN